MNWHINRIVLSQDFLLYFVHYSVPTALIFQTVLLFVHWKRWFCILSAGVDFIMVNIIVYYRIFYLFKKSKICWIIRRFFRSSSEAKSCLLVSYNKKICVCWTWLPNIGNSLAYTPYWWISLPEGASYTVSFLCVMGFSWMERSG